ncbi:MAG TPA: 50S ribosomal protein L24 [Candidatus Binatia bacterium]|jgi:large subunit ribosomal protein L24|nr:50S ribosomal protein L24 [Candidatus Binatia bacterium]
MARQKIKKNDTVIVIAGKERGKTGKVVRVFGDKGTVIVERVNMIKRHRKPQGPQNPGGILEKEAALHISNVMLICPSENTPTRIGRRQLDNGKWVRVSRRSKQDIDG